MVMGLVNNYQTIRSGGSVSTGHDSASVGGFTKPQVLGIVVGHGCPKFQLVKLLQT